MPFFFKKCFGKSKNKTKKQIPNEFLQAIKEKVRPLQCDTKKETSLKGILKNGQTNLKNNSTANSDYTCRKNPTVNTSLISNLDLPNKSSQTGEIHSSEEFETTKSSFKIPSPEAERKNSREEMVILLQTSSSSPQYTRVKSDNSENLSSSLLALNLSLQSQRSFANLKENFDYPKHYLNTKPYRIIDETYQQSCEKLDLNICAERAIMIDDSNSSLNPTLLSTEITSSNYDELTSTSSVVSDLKENNSIRIISSRDSVLERHASYTLEDNQPLTGIAETLEDNHPQICNTDTLEDNQPQTGIADTSEYNQLQTCIADSMEDSPSQTCLADTLIRKTSDEDELMKYSNQNGSSETIVKQAQYAEGIWYAQISEEITSSKLQSSELNLSDDFSDVNEISNIGSSNNLLNLEVRSIDADAKKYLKSDNLDIHNNLLKDFLKYTKSPNCKGDSFPDIEAAINSSLEIVNIFTQTLENETYQNTSAGTSKYDSNISTLPLSCLQEYQMSVESSSVSSSEKFNVCNKSSDGLKEQEMDHSIDSTVSEECESLLKEIIKHLEDYDAINPSQVVTEPIPESQAELYPAYGTTFLHADGIEQINIELQKKSEYDEMQLYETAKYTEKCENGDYKINIDSLFSENHSSEMKFCNNSLKNTTLFEQAQVLSLKEIEEKHVQNASDNEISAHVTTLLPGEKVKFVDEPSDNPNDNSPKNVSVKIISQTNSKNIVFSGTDNLITNETPSNINAADRLSTPTDIENSVNRILNYIKRVNLINKITNTNDSQLITHDDSSSNQMPQPIHCCGDNINEDYFDPDNMEDISSKLILNVQNNKNISPSLNDREECVFTNYENVSDNVELNNTESQSGFDCIGDHAIESPIDPQRKLSCRLSEQIAVNRTNGCQFLNDHSSGIEQRSNENKITPSGLKRSRNALISSLAKINMLSNVSNETNSLQHNGKTNDDTSDKVVSKYCEINNQKRDDGLRSDITKSKTFLPQLTSPPIVKDCDSRYNPNTQNESQNIYEPQANTYHLRSEIQPKSIEDEFKQTYADYLGIYDGPEVKSNFNSSENAESKLQSMPKNSVIQESLSGGTFPMQNIEYIDICAKHKEEQNECGTNYVYDAKDSLESRKQRYFIKSHPSSAEFKDHNLNNKNEDITSIQGKENAGFGLSNNSNLIISEKTTELDDANYLEYILNVSEEILQKNVENLRTSKDFKPEIELVDSRCNLRTDTNSMEANKIQEKASTSNEKFKSTSIKLSSQINLTETKYCKYCSLNKNTECNCAKNIPSNDISIKPNSNENTITNRNTVAENILKTCRRRNAQYLDFQALDDLREKSLSLFRYYRNKALSPMGPKIKTIPIQCQKNFEFTLSNIEEADNIIIGPVEDHKTGHPTVSQTSNKLYNHTNQVKYNASKNIRDFTFSSIENANAKEIMYNKPTQQQRLAVSGYMWSDSPQSPKKKTVTDLSREDRKCQSKEPKSPVKTSIKQRQQNIQQKDIKYIPNKPFQDPNTPNIRDSHERHRILYASKAIRSKSCRIRARSRSPPNLSPYMMSIGQMNGENRFRGFYENSPFNTSSRSRNRWKNWTKNDSNLLNRSIVNAGEYVLSPEEMRSIFDTKFKRYARNKRKPSDLITYKKSTQWLRDAGIVGTLITAEEADIEFKNSAGVKIALNKYDYKRFLYKLSRMKRVSYNEIYEKLCSEID